MASVGALSATGSRGALGAFAALTRLELRRRLRSPSAVALGLVVTLAVVAAYLLPGGAAFRGAAAALESSMFFATLATALVVTGAASSHPEDRASGAAAWLAATAAPAFARRVAPAAAAGLAAVGVAVAAALVGAVLAQATGLAVATRASRPVAIEGATLLVARAEGRAATEAVIPADASGGEVELDVRAVPRDPSVETTTLRVLSEDVERAVDVPVRGTVSLVATAGAVRVRTADRNVDVVVLGARRLGEPVSPLRNALLVALVVGLALACGAPLGALLSRGTSAPTAALGTAVLLLVGATRDGLLDLASGADAVRGGAMAAAVLRGATAIAPDLSALSAVGEATAGRALAMADVAKLGPAALYALVGTLLLGLAPDRRGPA